MQIVRHKYFNMAYSISYQTDGGVVTTYSGIVTDDDMFSCAKERTSSSDNLKKYKYFLSDFTDVEKFNVSSSAIKTIAHLTVQASKVNKNLIIVVIVPTDLEYGMSRMWAAYSDESNLKLHMTRTKEEALEYLNEQL